MWPYTSIIRYLLNKRRELSQIVIMAVLCREKEYLLLRRLVGAQQLESGSPKVPSVIFVHGGPQTGKKLLVSSVFKSLQSIQENKQKSKPRPKIRTALLSCHLGSFGSSALFEELWRQINSHDNNQSGMMVLILN